MSLLATVIALVLTSVPTEARRQGYEVLVAFGDSLSDVGNDFLATKRAGFNPAIPPSESPHMMYFGGRFSNGKVAVEYLWDLINPSPANSREAMKPSLAIDKIHNKGAVSFAFGASGTGISDPLPVGGTIPGLLGQVGLFQVALKGKAVPDDSLVVIFSGANDYYALPPPPPPPAVPPDPTPVIARVVGNIVGTVQRLYALGARDVVVVNLPDLGLVPLVQLPFKAGLRTLTIAHNQALALALTPLTQPGPALLPGLRLIQVSAFNFVENYPPSANPIPAVETLNIPWPPPGITFPVSACLFFAPSTCPNAPTFNVSPQFFFWDAQHPTTATHAAFGQYLYGSLPQ